MFNRSTFENSRPDGIATLQLIVAGPDGATKGGGFVPLQRTTLQGEVSGPLASLTLSQQFGFSAKEIPGTIEALYRFPLPGDAAVTGVDVRFGGVVIEARLAERTEAEAEYTEARQRGRQSALATRESPDVFTLRIAGIAPGEPVSVETRFVVRCRPEGDGWTLRIPLTTAPRYVREDETSSRHASGQPLAVLRDPGHRFSLDLSLRHAEDVQCRTHQILSSQHEDEIRVALAGGEVVPDRDFVLAWTGARDESRPTLHVSVSREVADDRLYLLGLVTPPRRTGRERPTSREVLVLVDHSGSMGGAKWEAADWAVKSFLSGLEAGDTFNLGLFHDSTRWYSRSPVPANPEQIEAAIRFLEAHKDSGGTELGVALEQALRQPRREGQVARHVLIVTDAEVTDGARILRLVGSEQGQGHRRRTSVICIDAAPNSLLVHELAARGGGSAHFLTSSASEGDITSALDELLSAWSAPLATNMRLEADGQNLEGPDGPAPGLEEKSWLDIGELPVERPAWFTARLPAGDLEQLSLKLTSSGGPLAACRVPISGPGNPAVKALFGARRVLALEYLRGGHFSDSDLRAELERLGYPAAELNETGQGVTVYPENRVASAKEALRKILVREALTFGLVSAETAFVASRKEAGTPVSATVVVANALPQGWEEPDYYAALSPAAPVADCMAAAPPPPSGLYLADMSTAETDEDIEDAYHASFSSLTGMADIAPAPGSDMLPTPRRLSLPWLRQERATGRVLFSGIPRFASGTAVLYESANDLGPRLSRLWLKTQGAANSGRNPARDLVLLIFVGDLTVPRAKMPVRALLQQGERPLNLTIHSGEPVKIVLEDPSGTWSANPPQIELSVC